MRSTVQERITTCVRNAIVKLQSGERTNIRPQIVKVLNHLGYYAFHSKTLQYPFCACVRNILKDICGYFQCAPFPRLETGKVIWVRCTINRSHSTPCKKAEFEYLQIFPGHCLDSFLPVSGKICHSSIKKGKDNLP